MVILLSSEEMSADEVYKFILAEVKADRKQNMDPYKCSKKQQKVTAALLNNLNSVFAA